MAWVQQRLFGDAPLAEKISLLEEIQQWDTPTVSDGFEGLWAALARCLVDGTLPKSLRQAALLASPSLLRVCCATQEMLSAFSANFSSQAKVLFEASMERLLNAFGVDHNAVAIPDPEDLLACLTEQRQCVEFFIKCTGVLASVSFEHDNIALNLFIEHFFSVIHPAIIRPNDITAKLSTALIESTEANKIRQEINALSTDALNILTRFVMTYIKIFPPSSSPSHALPCDDPKTTLVLQQIVLIGEKSGKSLKIQTAVWKLIRELILAHAHKIQNQTLLSKLISMAIGKSHSSWNISILHAPRMVQEGAELVPKGDEKSFENKIKASRFLWAVLGLLCRYYAHLCVPHFGKLVSIVLLIGRNLSTTGKPGALTPYAHKMVMTMHKTACNCLRALFSSPSMDDEKKIKLLEILSIRMGGEDPLSFCKLQVLLYLFEHLPSSALFHQAVSALYWVVNGVEACCSQILSRGLDTVVVPMAAFIYALSFQDPQSLQDVECFLYQHLFHPHFLCSQLAAELHSFLLQNADEALQRRHVLLLANLIKNGGNNVVDSLAPPFSLIVNSLSAANMDLLLRELSEDVLSHSDGLEDVALYRLATLLPAWTTRSAPLSTSVENTLARLAKLVSKQFASSNIPTSQLINISRCLSVLMAFERLPERDNVARAVLEHLGDVMRLATEEPIKYKATQLLPHLIDLSILIPLFSSDMLPNFLVAYGQVMSNFPSTKAAVAQFLARCSIKLRTDIQERVLRSCAGLYQQLLADGEWSVCAEAMQSFVHFVQFFPYPLESIQGLLSSECRGFLIDYLSGKLIALSKDQMPLSDAELCDHINTELAVMSRERLALAQASLIGTSSASQQESVDKALSLLAQATAILSTLPSSSLALAPQLNTQLNQISQLLSPSTCPGDMEVINLD